MEYFTRPIKIEICYLLNRKKPMAIKKREKSCHKEEKFQAKLYLPLLNIFVIFPRFVTFVIDIDVVLLYRVL